MLARTLLHASDLFTTSAERDKQYFAVASAFTTRRWWITLRRTMLSPVQLASSTSLHKLGRLAFPTASAACLFRHSLQEHRRLYGIFIYGRAEPITITSSF